METNSNLKEIGKIVLVRFHLSNVLTKTRNIMAATGPLEGLWILHFVPLIFQSSLQIAEYPATLVNLIYMCQNLL